MKKIIQFLFDKRIKSKIGYASIFDYFMGYLFMSLFILLLFAIQYGFSISRH
jgi:hypothetical protein